jgi:hypothetical protein
MKRHMFFLSAMILAVLALNSCEKDADRLCAAGPSGGDTVIFDSAEPIPVFSGCGQPMQAGVKIYDSRCPKDGSIQCVWQGILLADLTLGDNFTIHLEQNKIVDTVFRNEHYQIKLIDATPFPSAATMGKPQKAILSILKQ